MTGPQMQAILEVEIECLISAEAANERDPVLEAAIRGNMLLCELWLKMHRQWGGE